MIQNKFGSKIETFWICYGYQIRLVISVMTLALTEKYVFGCGKNLQYLWSIE